MKVRRPILLFAATVVCFAALASAQTPAPLAGGQTPAPPSARGNPSGPPTLAAQEQAAQVLAEARKALAGDRLSGLKTFTITGQTRQVRGNNLVPIVFEITAELPDKFVRKDEIPAQDTDPTTLGFAGDALIQFPAPPAGRVGGPPPSAATPTAGRAGGSPPPNPALQRLNGVKQDFVRLTLGMFATSFSVVPLTFAYAGEAEAPQGKAAVLDVTGPANFSARFVVQNETHLPVMLTWQLPPTNVLFHIPGQPPPAVVPPGAVLVDAPVPPAETATKEEQDQYAASIADLRRQTLARPLEYRVYYADYRDVDGFKLPFRIRRAIAGETVEETTIDRIRINGKVDPKKFEVSK